MLSPVPERYVIHLFISVDEPYSTTVNPLHRTQFYHARIILDFIEKGESCLLHPTRRRRRNQMENVARIEVPIVLQFFVAARRKNSNDEYNGDQGYEGWRNECANGCYSRVKADGGGGVDALCRDAHALWDDARTFGVQIVAVLCIHGTYELRQE